MRERVQPLSRPRGWPVNLGPHNLLGLIHPGGRLSICAPLSEQPAAGCEPRALYKAAGAARGSPAAGPSYRRIRISPEVGPSCGPEAGPTVETVLGRVRPETSGAALLKWLPLVPVRNARISLSRQSETELPNRTRRKGTVRDPRCRQRRQQQQQRSGDTIPCRMTSGHHVHWIVSHPTRDCVPRSAITAESAATCRICHPSCGARPT